MKWYEDLLKDEGVRPIDMRRNVPLINNPRNKDTVNNEEMSAYEALCRHEVPVVSLH